MTLSVNAFSRPKTRFSAPSVLSVLDLVLITQNLRVISVFSAPPRLGTRLARPTARFSAPSVLSTFDLVLITQNLRVISVFSAPPRLGTRSPGRRHDSPLPPFSQLLTWS